MFLREATLLNTAGSNKQGLSRMDDETSSSSGKRSTFISRYHCHPEYYIGMHSTWEINMSIYQYVPTSANLFKLKMGLIFPAYGASHTTKQCS